MFDKNICRQYNEQGVRMILDLSKLIKRVEQQYTVCPEFSIYKTNYGEYEILHKEPFTLKITKLEDDKIHIEGKVNLTLGIPCDRCLEIVETDISFDISKDIDFNNEDVEEDLTYIEGHNIDIDEMLYPEIFLNLPSKVLCSDDCKGLCQRCGKNLNEGSCDCGKGEIDPRLAPLQKILEEMKKNENKN